MGKGGSGRVDLVFGSRLSFSGIWGVRAFQGFLSGLCFFSWSRGGGYLVTLRLEHVLGAVGDIGTFV